jgi:hypothetical protein
MAARQLLAKRTAWVTVLPLVAVGGLIAFELTAHRSLTRGMPCGCLVYYLPFYVAAAYNQLGARRFVGRLEEHDYRLCCFCGYDLRSIPDQGRCPECGEWYDVRVTRKEWTDPSYFP